jgi:thioredoxin-like negative regulator of GroEL
MVKAEVFGPDTYDSCVNRVKKMTGILLIFHPGCGHCVQMRPAWESMKQGLPEGSKIVEVDGSAMSEHPNMRRLPAVKKLKGFPMIVRMKNGNPIEEYSGPRTPEEMGQFSRPRIQMGQTIRPRRKGKARKMKTRKAKTRKIDTRKKR